MLTFPPLGDPAVAGATWFADHAAARLAYALPPGLVAALDEGGDPEFLLVRYRDADQHGGGLLHVRLAWAPLRSGDIEAADVAGWTLEPVRFDTARVRLVHRLPLGGVVDPIGAWSPAWASGSDVAAFDLGLTPNEAQLVTDVLADPTNLLEVQAAVSYHGLVPGRPWLVRARRAPLDTALRAMLGDAPVSVAEIEAAFASLTQGDDGILGVTPLADDAPAEAPAVIAVEAARRALEVLFERAPADDRAGDTEGSDGGTAYRLLPVVASDAPVAFDLLPPRQQRESAIYTWSITELYGSLTDPAWRLRLFPSVTTVEPFATVTVPVVCDVPFDPRFLTRMQCDVRHTDGNGVPAFETLHFPEGGSVQTVRVTYPALTRDLDLAMRVRCTLAPPNGTGWPVTITRDYVSLAAPFVDIDRAATGIDFVRVEADPAAFDLVASFTVTVRPADAHEGVVELSTEHPAAWLALPGVAPADPLVATVVAHAPIGLEFPPPLVIRDGPVVGRRVGIDLTDVEVLAPDLVTITLDPVAAGDFAVVAITLEPPQGPIAMLTLEPAVPAHWAVRRSSVFAPVRFRYQLSLVPYDEDHHTLPLITTDWVDAEGTDLTVAPSHGVAPDPATAPSPTDVQPHPLTT